MTNLKFRAKHQGEWIYGLPVYLPNEEGVPALCLSTHGFSENGRIYEIGEPDTVGQLQCILSTGEKIYDGDILFWENKNMLMWQSVTDIDKEIVVKLVGNKFDNPEIDYLTKNEEE